MDEQQAINFVSNVIADFNAMLAQIKQAQATALQRTQEMTAHGGAAVITAAIQQANWDASFSQMTKAEFADAMSNLASAEDLLGSHGDLKPNLYRLKS